MATVRRKATPAAQPAGAPAPEQTEPIRPDYEVVGDELACHPYGDLRLSLAVSMPVIDRWTEINNGATSWREQVDAWRREIIPTEVISKIEAAAAGDGIREIELIRQWSAGLDVRLGKALS